LGLSIEWSNGAGLHGSADVAGLITNKKMRAWSLCVASNDQAILQENLLASPGIDECEQVIVQEGFSSAAVAYNDALDRVATDIVVFAHQDVYLPHGWVKAFQLALDRLEEGDPKWAVAGAYGTSHADPDAGLVYCVANGRMMGRVSGNLRAVDTLDELLLVVKKSSGLRFDQKIEGFHFYGTDICLEARSRGLQSYAFEVFCIHNAEKTEILPWAFWKSYFYIQKKWRRQLPIATPCIRVTAGVMDPLKHWIKSLRIYLGPVTRAESRVQDPNVLAARIQSHLLSK